MNLDVPIRHEIRPEVQGRRVHDGDSKSDLNKVRIHLSIYISMYMYAYTYILYSFNACIYMIYI
jgi:hypothetical protein